MTYDISNDAWIDSSKLTFSEIWREFKQPPVKKKNVAVAT